MLEQAALVRMLYDINTVKSVVREVEQQIEAYPAVLRHDHIQKENQLTLMKDTYATVKRLLHKLRSHPQKKEGGGGGGAPNYRMQSAISEELIAEKTREQSRFCGGDTAKARITVQKYYKYRLLDLGPEGEECLEKARERIARGIAKAGVLAFDIETVTNSSREGNFTAVFGNALPVVLCAYGSLNVLADQSCGSSSKDGGCRLLENVDVSFHGYDCVDQFIAWLVKERAIFDRPPTKFSCRAGQDLRRVVRNKYVPARTNYLVAHNGTRFDFRFLLDSLSKIAKLSILGDTTKMKSLTFKNIVLTDSFLLLPFSLARLCRMLRTKQQK